MAINPNNLPGIDKNGNKNKSVNEIDANWDFNMTIVAIQKRQIILCDGRIKNNYGFLWKIVLE